MKKEKPFTAGSGDIFKDLGFSEEESAGLNIRAGLFMTLQEALRNTPGTQTKLAAILGVPQPKISDILKGKISGFSIERIANYLLKLNYEIHVNARPAKTGTKARIKLVGIKKKLAPAP